jgi:type VI protein secretion system component VasF
MANGSHKEGPARADRFREEAEKHERLIQRSFDDLPPYREEMDSEITVNTRGIHVRRLRDRTVLLLALFALLAFCAWLRWR